MVWRVLKRPIVVCWIQKNWLKLISKLFGAKSQLQKPIDTPVLSFDKVAGVNTKRRLKNYQILSFGLALIVDRLP